MFNFDRLKEFYSFLKCIEGELSTAPVFSLYAYKSKSRWLSFWATVLSSRTSDRALLRVLPLIEKNFSNPYDVISKEVDELQEILKPLGFYRKKAKIFWDLNFKIINDFNCEIPDNLNDLLKLPGVGFKVASIILNDLYGVPLVGVDVHVFRILNRVGIVKTKDPNQTWKVINENFFYVNEIEIYHNLNKYLVAFGQTFCKVKPNCFKCGFKIKCDYYRRENYKNF